jgi:hypothetical protein
MSGSENKLMRIKGEALIKRLGVRVIILRAGTFADLQKGVEGTIGREAQAAFYEAGMRAGRGWAKVRLKVWKEWKEKGTTFIKKWGGFHKSAGSGWFKLKEANLDFEKRNAFIRITHSFIAEEYGKSDAPVCHFLCGYFVGVLQEVFRKKLTCEEVKCTAKGDPYCEFKIEEYT